MGARFGLQRDVVELRIAAELERVTRDAEHRVRTLADNGQMRGVHRGEEVARERPGADHMQGGILAVGELIHRDRKVRDGVGCGAGAVDCAFVRNIDIGHAEARDLLVAAAEHGIVQLPCHDAVSACGGMQVLFAVRKQRAALGIGIGELVEVDEVILARVLRRKLACDAFLRGVQHRRCAQIVHGIRGFAVDGGGDIDAFGVRFVAEQRANIAIVGLKLLQRAVRAADGCRIVRAHRDDVERRVALLGGQRVGQHLHVVAPRAREESGGGNAVVGNNHLHARLLRDGKELCGISLCQTIRGRPRDRQIVALGDAVADERDAQRLVIGLRRAVDHVKALCRKVKPRGIGQRCLLVFARIRLDLRCINDRARRKGGRAGDGHIKIAAQHLRVARLRVVGADEFSAKGTAADVDLNIAVRRVILSVRRSQRGSLGRACRHIVQSALRKNRGVESAARDVQRGIIGKNGCTGNADIPVVLVVRGEVIVPRLAEGAAVDCNGDGCGD